MPNPFNPLDWLRTAQDWFTRTERSSGFRPYLIYLIFSAGLGAVLLAFFPTIELFALTLIGLPIFCFIPLYVWKAGCDPDFCRSETHIQRLKKIELEMMGSDMKPIEGEVLEQRLLSATEKEPAVLDNLSGKEGDR